MDKNLILIKLGGSLITDKNKPYTARSKTIANLARQIKKAYLEGFKIVVSHGSGSFGHTSASKYQTAEGIKGKDGVYGLCIVQQDAIAINRIVNKIFLEIGVPCLSFVPSSFCLARKGKRKAIFARPMIEAIKREIVPIVFGDVVMDEAQGCCIFSGEVVLDNLSYEFQRNGFRIIKVIQCGITDGVYDLKGRIIPKITPENFSIIKKALVGASGTDVTGGMLHKVEESLKMAKQGVKVWIINGLIKDSLYKSIISKPGKGTLVSS